MRVPDSTLSGLEPRPQRLLAVWGRRAFLAVLLVLVLAGLGGLLGVRTETATAERNGYTMQRGRDATVAVVDDALVPLVSVEIDTFLLP